MSGERLVRNTTRRLHKVVRAGAGMPGRAWAQAGRGLRAGLLTAGGRRALRAGLGIVVTLAVAAGVTVGLTSLTSSRAPAHRASGTAAAGGKAAASTPASARKYLSLLNAIGQAPTGSALAQAAAARAQLGETETVAEKRAGLITPGSGVLAAPAAAAGPTLPPAGPLQPADLMVVGKTTLPAATVTAIKAQPGVAAVNQLDAGQVHVNDSAVDMIGVDPATFRPFAASATAGASALWQNVAGGDIALSYLLGQQENIPLGGTVTVGGSVTRQLTAGGFGTVGLDGVDAVTSDSVARSLGLPAGNALVISAPKATLSTLVAAVKAVLPSGAGVVPLVSYTTPGTPARTVSGGGAGAAGDAGVPVASGPALTAAQTRAFLTAALSRVGLPYVYAGNGPNVFDCSGLVKWSMTQIGVTMPRVAVNQAKTGPSVPISQLQPGDLLFYHTDPTAPDYISHVAIYLGGGMMVQAPRPGLDVEVVPAEFGSEYAGAVQVDPQLAASVAASTG
jgi:cell wall-associated NlpC family hydrolase